MARNLHKAGLLRAVWNRTTTRADELAAELGVVAAANPAALARDCDVIVLCVRPMPTCSTSSTAAARLAPGASSSTARPSRDTAARPRAGLRQRVEFLDAP
jgi:3-hydroxyisobutyrate dehydrogenase